MDELSAKDQALQSLIQRWKISARAEYDAGLQRLRENPDVPGPITERDEMIYRFAFRISWAHAVELVSVLESDTFRKTFRTIPSPAE